MSDAKHQTLIEALNTRKTRMVDYLLLKVSEQDWHGVADAAMDIRDIEAEVKGVLSVIDASNKNE